MFDFLGSEKKKTKPREMILGIRGQDKLDILSVYQVNSLKF